VYIVCYLQVIIENEVQSVQIKVTKFGVELVSDCLEAVQHYVLHARL
jgi:hypothetical protein